MMTNSTDNMRVTIRPPTGQETHTLHVSIPRDRTSCVFDAALGGSVVRVHRPRVISREMVQSDPRKDFLVLGMEQLSAARARQRGLQGESVVAARKAAAWIAATLAQDIDFTGGEFGYGYTVTGDGHGGWTLNLLTAGAAIPHTAWGYKECYDFGEHVGRGLIVAMAKRLESLADQEAKTIRMCLTGKDETPGDDRGAESLDGIDGLLDRSEEFPVGTDVPAMF